MRASVNRAANIAAQERLAYALHIAAHVDQLRQMAATGAYWSGDGITPAPNPVHMCVAGMYLRGNWRSHIEQRLMYPGYHLIGW